MITVRQMKAARALLAWTQRDLAEISGISLAAIAQIESGKGNPRVETINTIQSSFEKYEIEFTDDPGVRVRKEPFSCEVWQGHEAMLRCWKDIEETLSPGEELLVSCVDDDLWMSLYPDEMLEMFESRTKAGIFNLGLLTSPEKNRSDWPSCNYRIVPEDATSPHAPYYVYNNKVAIIRLKDPIRIVVIDNPTVADSFRIQFRYHWNRGKKY